MRPFALTIAIAVLCAGLPAQERLPNLPVQPIGPSDLIALSVYDSAELTRTFRVDTEGNLSLPMIKRAIHAAGLLPSDLEKLIATALSEEEILIQPIVKVAVAEYYSRPISVMGAVRKPTTFQAYGPVTLLEALARAEGLSEFASPEVLVTRPGATEPIRIPVPRLIDDADAASNLKLTGGEEIRVPEASKIYIAGNVRKPGAIAVRDKDQLTVLKMIALAEGLSSYASKQAYIYRKTTESPGKREILVELHKIMKREAPDVTLEAHDVLYVPDDSKKRIGMTVLDRIVLFGSTAGATALVWRR
ncbi:MAG: polysaccharide biosynthesis/export family protein [Bryobacteraceae bacterium]